MLYPLSYEGVGGLGPPGTFAVYRVGGLEVASLSRGDREGSEAAAVETAAVESTSVETAAVIEAAAVVAA